ncbi:hypothetical protein NK356_10525 [Chryseobacterium sp. S0630]|uniref:hypothetical protein n=1 Tax=Chryseobacterium sp. S0630 TaxID=2957803 RepID=UPI00209EEB70|nr:hypothetical protein [Chryseobacterium sp. S0630]MCP1299602.1 hypothetical protein [Chryseobacterium sp. S0630]
MRKVYLVLLSFLFSTVSYSQVGINTTTPAGTFDVVGKATDPAVQDGFLPPRLTGDQLKAKDLAYSMAQNGTMVFATSAVTTVSPKTINVTSAGFYYYDAVNAVWVGLKDNSSNSGTSLYASKDGAWSLVNLGISGTNWNKINLSSQDVKTGTASLLNTGVYTAAKSGIYEVAFETQLAGGIDLSILGGKKMGILKNGTTIFEEKVFDAVRVSILGVTLAAVPVTSTTLTGLIKLNAGETIAFAIETGGVNLTLLTDGKVSVSVFKVSD